MSIDSDELVPTGKLNEFGEEYHLLRESDKFAYINRNGVWLRTRFDGTTGRSKASNYKEADPYKQVWNDTKDEEAELIERTRNGVLFAPTYHEMAMRYKKKAQFLFYKARKLGRSVAGVAAFEEGISYCRLARHAMDQHLKSVAVSR